jgi:hypothetical protein
MIFTVGPGILDREKHRLAFLSEMAGTSPAMTKMNSLPNKHAL